jgi:uncharacterized membrane protein YgdD (TMEM256/DUF423 family)
MATPFFIGIGAIAAGLAGRHFLRRSAMGAADQWVKGGFKAKMDRKEALAILGLKCACAPTFRSILTSDIFIGTALRSN